MRGVRNFIGLRERTATTYNPLRDLIRSAVRNADSGMVNNVHEILDEIKKITDSFSKSYSKIFRSFERILDKRGCEKKLLEVYRSAQKYFQKIVNLGGFYSISYPGYRTLISRLYSSDFMGVEDL